jgi:hypothetical protein
VQQEEGAKHGAERIRHAVEAIGEGRSDDYIFRPTGHAEALEHQAPALARVLQSSRMKPLAEQYERLSEEAERAKGRFSADVSRASVAMLVVALLAPLVMVVGILEPLVAEGMGPEVAKVVVQRALFALGFCSLLAAALANMWLSKVRGRLQDLKSKENEAMQTRLLYFNKLMLVNDNSPSESPLWLLKLEYFRRYQLKAQIAYCDRYYKEHRTAAEKRLTQRGLAVAVATFASGAVALVASFDALLASLAAFGVMATAWLVYLDRHEAIYQDRQEAERLGRTRLELENRSMVLDDVRERVEEGSESDLHGYVDAVHQIVQAAHSEWVTSIESIGEAVASMEKATEQQRRPAAGDAVRPREQPEG